MKKIKESSVTILTQAGMQCAHTHARTHAYICNWALQEKMHTQTCMYSYWTIFKHIQKK